MLDLNVLVAADGEEGLDVVMKNDDIGLVISDVHMPKMDGLEMTQYLKKNGFDKPVIILTQESRDEFVQKAKQVGASGWMVKPFRREEVVQIVTQSS